MTPAFIILVIIAGFALWGVWSGIYIAILRFFESIFRDKGDK